MVTELEIARSLLWFAAYEFDAAPGEATKLAALAKIHIDQIARTIARLATEVHGAYGFSELSGVHLWFKRIMFNRALAGSPEELRQMLHAREVATIS
jgi:alkylation response protein AidB-like acyl-CoA dehydrogenase